MSHRAAEEIDGLELIAASKKKQGGKDNISSKNLIFLGIREELKGFLARSVSGGFGDRRRRRRMPMMMMMIPEIRENVRALR